MIKVLNSKHIATKVILSMIFLLMVSIVIFCLMPPATVSAESKTETIYTNNCPGGKDYKHILRYDTSKYETYMNKNVTGWVKKDHSNPIEVGYSESVTNTISASFESGLSANLGNKMLGMSATLKSNISYTYSATTMKSFKWTIRPNERGEYFCIGVNYKSIKVTGDHYKQKFKLFGQGPYNYEFSSVSRTPSESYLAKNFRYDINGSTYES